MKKLRVHLFFRKNGEMFTYIYTYIFILNASFKFFLYFKENYEDRVESEGL